MISPLVRSFSTRTIDLVTGTSRASRWRWRKSPDSSQSNLDVTIGSTGADIVAYMQARRARVGLPPLPEQEILNSLEAVEDAYQDGRTKRVRRITADLRGMSEVST